MASKGQSTVEVFQTRDPVAAFAAYAGEERQRMRETEPDYDDGIHQEAVALVLQMLGQRLAPPAQG